MNDKVLSIVIKAQDKASAVLTDVEAKVESTSSKVVAAASKMAKAGAIAAAVATGAISVNAVQSAINLNESINAVEKTFGRASEKIFEFGKVSAEQAGLSKSAFNSAVVPIGSMLRNMGYEEDRAADSAVELGKRAADLASVFNTSLEDALVAIQAGLRGEADPLERFGVGLSQTAVQAYAVRNGLIAQGQAMDSATLASARLGLFLEQTTRYAGDFANTSDQAANKSRILKAEWEDMSARIGASLLPVWEKLLSAGRYAMDVVLPGIGNAIASAKTKFDELWPSIQTIAGVIAGMFTPTLKALWNTLSTQLFPALQRMWELISPVLVPAILAVAAVLGGVFMANLWIAMNGLNLLIKVISNVTSWLSTFWGRVIDVGGAIVSFFGGLPGRVGNAFASIRDRLTAPIEAALGIIRGIADRISGVVNGIMDKVNSVKNAASSAVSSIKGKIPGFASGTDYAPGGLAMVGERGPELVNLPRGSKVYSNDETKGMLGSSYNFYGNIVLTSPQAVDRFADRFEMGELGVGV